MVNKRWGRFSLRTLVLRMSKGSTFILGISAFYHDAAACLLKDGVIIAAIHEERITRKKHDERFPINSIEFCLKEAKISINEIDMVAYYEKPILKFDRILGTFINSAPHGFIPFKMGIKSWMKEKLWVSSVIKKKLGYKGEIKFCKHHESHAAASYFTSAFDSAAFLTIDGVGEKATTTFGVAEGNKLTTLKEIHFPHSIGLLYSAFTYYCGFKVNSGEYKLMGLAPYGEPKYVNVIKERLIDIKDDGSFILNMEYFAFNRSLKMINENFCLLFGQPVRDIGDDLTVFYKDIAASIQKVTEEVVMGLAREVKRVTGQSNLCLSGGVALNCVVNGVLQRANFFENCWVNPAAGDGGSAMGAALLIWNQYFNNSMEPRVDLLSSHSYLGSSYSLEEIKNTLMQFDVEYHQLNEEELIKRVASLLQEKAVVGWFSGRSEFGPRALGNRSILASPNFEDMQKHLNLKIKKREGFRPFAPIVMEEYASEWFELRGSSKSMLFTCQCKQPEKIPSCVHVDKSSRVQTLSEEDNQRLYQLLEECRVRSGVPVLINTSFNVRGEPIVNTPDEAIRCFFNTDMDVLVLGEMFILKKEQSLKNKTRFTVAYELD